MSVTRHNIILPEDLWEEVTQYVKESNMFETPSQFVRWAVREALDDRSERI